MARADEAAVWQEEDVRERQVGQPHLLRVDLARRDCERAGAPPPQRKEVVRARHASPSERRLGRRAPSTKVSVELWEEKASVEPVASKATSRTQPSDGISKKSVPNFGLAPHLVSHALPSTALMYAEKMRHL